MSSDPTLASSQGLAPSIPYINGAPPPAFAPPSASSLPPQELIILCGLIGSGKSTLSTSIVRLLPPSSTSRGWVRVNQDELGDRRACEALVRSALKRGMNVLVDRQNFDRKQRRTWLELAQEFEDVSVGGWVMGTSLQECERRLSYRTDHPTIADPQLGVRLLHQFLKQWEEPRINEGFDHLLTLPSLPPSSDITPELPESLLHQLWTSPKNAMGATQRLPRSSGPRSGAGAGASHLPWSTTKSGAAVGTGQRSLDQFGFGKAPSVNGMGQKPLQR